MAVAGMAEAGDPTGAVVAFTAVAAVFTLAEGFMGAEGSTAEAGFAEGLADSGVGAHLAAVEDLEADHLPEADLRSEALAAETEDSVGQVADLAAGAREWDGTSGA